MLSCDQVADKYTRPVMVQSGWRETFWDGVTTRYPIMVRIYPKWQLQKCGALEKDRVAQCAGCQHA